MRKKLDKSSISSCLWLAYRPNANAHLCVLERNFGFSQIRHGKLESWHVAEDDTVDFLRFYGASDQ
jgi:hypothetical protein